MFNNHSTILLPRDGDATHAEQRGYVTPCPLSGCPSVRLSVTFRYRNHTCWNSLRHQLTLTPTWAIWSNGNTFKIRME